MQKMKKSCRICKSSVYTYIMSIAEIMIVVWAVVIALSLFIEFLTYHLVSIWFAPAALVAMIMAAINTWADNTNAVPFWAQIITFVVLSIVFILTFRPLMRKVFVRDTIPTNITDSNIGKQLRLMTDSIDGHATIELNGVIWKVQIEGEDNLPKETMVELTGSLSNKFIAKKVIEKQPTKKENSAQGNAENKEETEEKVEKQNTKKEKSK